MMSKDYVYKKEVDWSLLMEGITLPVSNHGIFGKIMDRLMVKGESKPIKLYLNGKTYDARVVNVNYSQKYKRKSDVIQIRYSKNGDISRALQASFARSYTYLKALRDARESGDRHRIKIPDDQKEYIAIYTTVYEDTYILEPIYTDEIKLLRESVAGQQERLVESVFDYNVTDENAGYIIDQKLVKLRRLNYKISEALKELYNYRCQICGRTIGEEYSAHVIEAHHIDYYVNSLNNDADNQIIVCPNHHSIIHDVNPAFDRRRLMYVYQNGFEERLVLNQHL